MIRDSMIPDVPEEITAHHVKPTFKNLPATHNYVFSMNKSKPKDYSATTTSPLRHENLQFKRQILNMTQRDNQFNNSLLNYSQSIMYKSRSAINNQGQEIEFQQSPLNTMNQANKMHRQFSYEQKKKEDTSSYQMNLVNMMREQLEISHKSLNFRMMEEIRKNNDQLMKLEKKLKQNQVDLQLKEREIMKLRDLIEKYVLKPSSDPKFSLSKAKSYDDNVIRNYEYITNRMQDLESKVRIIAQSKQEKTSFINKLLQKLQLVRDQVLVLETVKAKNIEEKFIRFMSIQEQILQNLEDQLYKSKNTVSNQQYNKFQTKNSLSYSSLDKLQTLNQQFIKIKTNLQKFCSKQFKYDHFQLDKIKFQLLKINKKIQSMQTQQKNKIISLSIYQQQYKNLTNSLKNQPFKCPNCTINTNATKKQFVISRKLPTFGEIQKMQDYVPEQDEQQVINGTEDIFFYPSKLNRNQSSFQKFSDEDDQELMIIEDQQQQVTTDNPKRSRLLEIIQLKKHRMPLYCEIDQTGYLKYKDSGMYIFDKDGNLFELNNKELKELLDSKIIKVD